MGGAATQYGASALKQILRQQLKFGGVILSDDLSMKAVRSPAQPFSEVIRSSVRAGVDIVVVSRINDDDETADTGAYANSAILAGVRSGEIDREAIDSSVQRIEYMVDFDGAYSENRDIPKQELRRLTQVLQFMEKNCAAVRVEFQRRLKECSPSLHHKGNT